MMIRTEDAVRMAGRVLRRYGTRDPDRLAQEMGIIVMARPFEIGRASCRERV